MIELNCRLIKEIQRNVIVVKIDCNHSNFKIAIEQAKKKSNFTMNASQNGQNRSQLNKYNKQLMGTIAEIACEKYLERVLEKESLSGWSVIRYDDVRTDGFTSAQNEYDIKITNGENILYIESRSSITYNRSFIQGLQQYDIIGPYTSSAKSNEDYNDIYLRPLYEYKDHQMNNYDDCKFEQYLRNGKVQLYLVAGCLKEDMINSQLEKNMKQDTTKYKVVQIMQAKDCIDFQQDIKNLLN